MDYELNKDYEFEFAGQIKKGKFLGTKVLFDNSIVYMMKCSQTNKIYPVKKIMTYGN